MRAVEIGPEFGLDHLGVVERPRPRPGPGQILLRVAAASLNYRDLLMVAGRYNPKQPLPLIPCSDGVGVVEELGPNAVRFSPGDRVIPIFAQRWISGRPARDTLRSTLGGPLDGTLAEWMVIGETGAVRAPGHLSDVEAATLPCAAVTAWNAIEPLRTGDTVLILGTGGVAVFALQLAVARGARAIVLSSSDEKRTRATELGATHTLNYRTVPEWGKTVREMTDGRGVDVVVEVGGAGTLSQSLAATGFGGQISVIGNLTGASLELDLISVFMRRIRLQGILVGSRESFEQLNRTVEEHELRPVVDRVFDLDGVREAFSYMRSGVHLGKICVEVGGSA
jgi:NADPH:quinone reductase-like Zn-dependent oxidoreductase